ncbi:MAG: MFS transporter [Actinomycetota bacterium]|nr:MFS transporter [Actinomycetota bacterium]
METVQRDGEAHQEDYRRNFTGGLIHGVFFQLSEAFSNINTVLPSFVATLTGSTVVIGLMVVAQEVGHVLPQMLTAYRVEDRAYEKPILMWIITMRWVSWGLLAAATAVFALDQPDLVLILLVGLFAAFSLAGGVGSVVYADVFAKAIPTQRRGRFIGWKQLIGYTLAIGAGWVVAWILSDPDRIPYPTNYALIFALAAVFLLIALAGIAIVREPPSTHQRQTESLAASVRRAAHLTVVNKNFRRLLTARGLTAVLLLSAPFFVLFALNDVGVDQAAVGLYLAAQMTGAALSNLLWGWLGDRFGNRTVIIGTSVAGLGAPLTALAALVAGPFPLYVTFFLVGATLSGLRLGYANIILEMAPDHLRATCVALLGTLLAPLALLPLVIGIVVTWIPLAFVLAVDAVAMAGAVVASILLRKASASPDRAGFAGAVGSQARRAVRLGSSFSVSLAPRVRPLCSELRRSRPGV